MAEQKKNDKITALAFAELRSFSDRDKAVIKKQYKGVKDTQSSWEKKLGKKFVFTKLNK